MPKKDLARQQEHGRALLPVFLGQMMNPPNMVIWGLMTISPKMNPLCSYNTMMKLLKKNYQQVTNLNIQQVTLKGDTPNLQHDHQVLQEKIEQIINGGDVNALFPVNHNEKFLHLKYVEECEEDWKSELDHLEGLLASGARFVTRIEES